MQIVALRGLGVSQMGHVLNVCAKYLTYRPSPSQREDIILILAADPLVGLHCD